MADEPTERRLTAVERKLDNGVFVRRAEYESDQRAIERTGMDQERRIAEFLDRVRADVTEAKAAAVREAKEIRERDITRIEADIAQARQDTQWLQRQLIIMLLGILSVAAVAALAFQAAR